MISYVTLLGIYDDTKFAMLEGVPKIDDMLDGLQTSPFEASLPNEPQEIQLILVWEHNSNFKENNTNRGSIDVLSWPRIFFSLLPSMSITLVDYLILYFHHCFLKVKYISCNRKSQMSGHIHEYVEHLLTFRHNII